MTNRPEHSDRLLRSGWKKLDLNLRVYRQVRERKQAHAVIADIDTKRFQAARIGEYVDRSVEQLAVSAPPV